MLPHARASSRWGYDPDGPVVMAPFRGSKLEEFPSQPEIKRSCQWVHRHHPRPSRPSLGVVVKWWVAAPSGPEKLNDGEPRRSGKTTTITDLIHMSATCAQDTDSWWYRTDRRSSCQHLIGPPVKAQFYIQFICVSYLFPPAKNMINVIICQFSSVFDVKCIPSSSISTDLAVDVGTARVALSVPVPLVISPILTALFDSTPIRYPTSVLVSCRKQQFTEDVSYKESTLRDNMKTMNLPPRCTDKSATIQNGDGRCSARARSFSLGGDKTDGRAGSAGCVGRTPPPAPGGARPPLARPPPGPQTAAGAPPPVRRAALRMLANSKKSSRTEIEHTDYNRERKRERETLNPGRDSSGLRAPEIHIWDVLSILIFILVVIYASIFRTTFPIYGPAVKLTAAIFNDKRTSVTSRLTYRTPIVPGQQPAAETTKLFRIGMVKRRMRQCPFSEQEGRQGRCPVRMRPTRETYTRTIGRTMSSQNLPWAKRDCHTELLFLPTVRAGRARGRRRASASRIMSGDNDAGLRTRKSNSLRKTITSL
ncbi:hypothetical protein EVAR_58802_1 [Eumeta japonica]|uniref:Uncharacterized protein n=1 Tax=Eumeta variegata TaxID=151549 RepID=A0A4C1YGM0_EUMVA|nr:hypothetical protein EVAR_58802_1 [Eumeta japonica]